MKRGPTAWRGSLISSMLLYSGFFSAASGQSDFDVPLLIAEDAGATMPADSPSPPPLAAETPAPQPYVSPFAGNLWERPVLLGDICGLRTCLGEHGVKFDASATGYYQGVASGGNAQEFRFGGRNDYYLAADGQKLGLWQGLFVDLHGETRYGEAVNGLTGTFSPPNMGLLFPVPNQSVTALTQVKFTQALSENFAVFAGKINLVDNYLNPFAAGKGQTQFMNTAFCIPPIFGGTVPVYSSLGAGFAMLRGGEPIVSLMIIDPVNSPTTSGFEHFFQNGVALFGNVILPVKLAERPGHQGVYFAWSNRQATSFDDAVYVQLPSGPVPVFQTTNTTWTLLYTFDQYLFVDPSDPKRGWGAFGQFAISDGVANPIRWSATLGVGGSSPLKSRPLDTFGVGYYFFQASTGLRNSLAPVLPIGNENGVELYYNIGVTKWLHVTPDFQVLDPTRQDRNTALVVGVRARIDF